MKKLLVWGYALQSMDKVEKMGLPRVSLQESLKKRLSKSISVGGCSSTNSPKRLD
ncbi:hypothetical protein [Veillonella sp. Ser01]